MFCTVCGKPNDDDALFCEFCGAEIEEQAPPETVSGSAPDQLFCEKCGKPNDLDALFCEFCGAKFEEAAAPEPEPIPEPEPEPEPVQAAAPVTAPRTPQKRKKVGIIAAIASAAAIIVAVIIIVIANGSRGSGDARMKINGKNVPVEMALFDYNGDTPTLYFCGKNDSGAYICTVSFEEFPSPNSTYSASNTSVTISYSGKDTKVSDGAHKYAFLSTDTTGMSLGKYKSGEYIEFSSKGKTTRDVYMDFDGTFKFSVSGVTRFNSYASDIVDEWKKVNKIPE